MLQASWPTYGIREYPYSAYKYESAKTVGISLVKTTLLLRFDYTHAYIDIVPFVYPEQSIFIYFLRITSPFECYKRLYIYQKGDVAEPTKYLSIYKYDQRNELSRFSHVRLYICELSSQFLRYQCEILLTPFSHQEAVYLFASLISDHYTI